MGKMCKSGHSVPGIQVDWAIFPIGQQHAVIIASIVGDGSDQRKDGRAPHFLRKRVTLLFNPSLPANSSDCFVFPFCFSRDVKWSALKHQRGASVCALSAPSEMCAEISVSCRIPAPQNLFETEHKCLSVIQSHHVFTEMLLMYTL